MIKAVYDTNVLISAFIAKGKSHKALNLILTGKVRLILSSKLLDEFVNVISRKKFGFNQHQVEKMTTILLRVSEIVQPKKKVNLIKEDPDDNMLFECANAGQAQFIVSGDIYVLRVKNRNKIKTITVSDLIENVK